MEEKNKLFDGKLSLNKETIAELNNKQLHTVKGGGFIKGRDTGKGDDDFDVPTFYDDCFSDGTTTFADACTWCGFWHETDR